VPQQPSDLRDVTGRRITVQAVELLVAVYTHGLTFAELPSLNELAGLLDCKYERVRKIGMRYERRGLLEIVRDKPPFRMRLTDDGVATLAQFTELDARKSA
jgi:hypothetical protein